MDSNAEFYYTPNNKINQCYSSLELLINESLTSVVSYLPSHPCDIDVILIQSLELSRQPNMKSSHTLQCIRYNVRILNLNLKTATTLALLQYK